MKGKIKRLPLRNHFLVGASGKEFDVDKYLSKYPLKVDLICRRGECVPGRDFVSEFSGFWADLGWGPDLELEDQQTIAIKYIERNQAKLKKLQSFPGVTNIYLGLQGLVYPDSAGSIFDLCPALMKLAVKVGIEITLTACVRPEPYRLRRQPKKKSKRK